MERILQQIAIHFATLGINDNRCHVLMKGSESPNVKNGIRLFEDKEVAELEQLFHKHLHYNKYSCVVDGAWIYFEGSSYQSSDKLKRWVVFERVHIKQLDDVNSLEHKVLLGVNAIENHRDGKSPIVFRDIKPETAQTLVFASVDDSITFMNRGKVLLKLVPSGEVFVGEKPICKDIEIVEALKKFLQINDNVSPATYTCVKNV